MIFSVLLVNEQAKRTLALYDYWVLTPTRKQLLQYLRTLKELREKSESQRYKTVIVDEFKFLSRECNDGILLIYVSKLDTPDDILVNSINRAAQSLRKKISNLSRTNLRSKWFSLIDPFVKDRVVISLVGESGVGKTSLLHLLMGKRPPKEHHPTIVVNTELIEQIRFANYEITIIDFAGQEQSRELWDFSNTDIVFLVTDSTLKNVIASKGIISRVKKQNAKLPIFVFANKQDLPNALDASAIGKVLGVASESMIAVDLAYRNNLLTYLVEIFCNYFGVSIPDLLADDILLFASE